MTSLKLWKEPIEDKFWNDPFAGMIDLFFERPSFVEKVYKRSNIATTDEDYRIQLAVPGLSKDDVKISVDNSVISISHEKKETDDTNHLFHQSTHLYFICKVHTLPNNYRANRFKCYQQIPADIMRINTPISLLFNSLITVNMLVTKG